jgi:hypothetical protein
MPQVLTRRSEPIHPSSQARSPAPTNPKTGSGSDHPGGRSPQSLLNLTLTLSGYCCTLSNCTHRLVSQSHSHWVQLHAEQPHPPPLSSHSDWVQLHAEQPHPPPRLILCQSPSLLTLASLRAGPRLSFSTLPHARKRSVLGLLWLLSRGRRAPALPPRADEFSSLSTRPHARRRSVFSVLLWLLPRGRRA